MGDLLLQESIAFLKKSGTNGKNLYDHLSDVIVKLLEQKPDNAYSVFENVSSLHFCTLLSLSPLLLTNFPLHLLIPILLPFQFITPHWFYSFQDYPFSTLKYADINSGKKRRTQRWDSSRSQWYYSSRPSSAQGCGKETSCSFLAS